MEQTSKEEENTFFACALSFACSPTLTMMAATNKTIRVRPSRGGLTKKVSLREGGDLSHYCRGRWMHSSCAPCLIDQGFLSSETRLMQSSSTKDAHFWAGDHLTLTTHHRYLLGVRHEHATRSILDKTLRLRGKLRGDGIAAFAAAPPRPLPAVQPVTRRERQSRRVGERARAVPPIFSDVEDSLL